MRADLDVRRGTRDFKRIVEQVVAARLVQPHLFETIQQIHQTIVKPIVPCGGLTSFPGELPVLCMENHSRHAKNYDAQRKREYREIGNIDCNKENENDSLAGERQHVGSLREDSGFFRDGRNDLGSPDLIEREKFGVAHLVHQAHPQFVNDRFDLDSCRDQNVVLRLDEKEQRYDKQRCRKNADLTIARRLCAGIDRRQNCRIARTTKAGHDNQPIERALHLAANKLEEGHQRDVVRLSARTALHYRTQENTGACAMLNFIACGDLVHRDVTALSISTPAARRPGSRKGISKMCQKNPCDAGYRILPREDRMPHTV